MSVGSQFLYMRSGILDDVIIYVYKSMTIKIIINITSHDYSHKK